MSHAVTLVVNDTYDENVLVSGHNLDPVEEEEEEEEENPLDELQRLRGSGSERNLIGFASVIFLTVNATLGAGMLNIPYAFSQSGGLLYSTIFQFIHVLIVIASLMILSLCAEISRTDSFKNLVAYFCGATWATINTTAVIFYSFGSCVTYIIITGDQIDKIFATFYGPTYADHIYMSRGFLMTLLSLVAILPLCYSKDISFLKFASFIGFCSTLYLSALVLFEWYRLAPPNQEAILAEVLIGDGRWYEAFYVAPVLTFSYQCQLSWVPTYVKIKRRSSNGRLLAMAVVSMMICFASYTFVAFFGLLTFGAANIDKDLMQNYDPRDPLVAIGMGLLVIKSVVIYPLLLFVGRKVLEDWAATFYDDTRLVVGRFKASTVVRIGVATAWLVASCLLAVFVPNIAVAINYLGSLANLFIFILPGMCLYFIALDPLLVDRVNSAFCRTLGQVSIAAAGISLVVYGFFTLYISILQTLHVPI